MNWLKRFLGIYDKEQAKTAVAVEKYLSDTKVTFISEMKGIKKEAIKLHRQTKKAHETSIKISDMVDDVVNKIAIATGGRKVTHD